MRTGKPVLMFFTSSKNAASSASIKNELFASDDIVIAYPQRDVHLDGELKLVRPQKAGDK